MEKQKSVGVVIGRFQTHQLHVGHMHILNTASSNNDELCVILGEHGGVSNDRNPLDVATRAKMITKSFPSAKTLSVSDSRSDTVWSQKVDQLLKQNFGGNKVTLYGSRDSFVPYYNGSYETIIVDEVPNQSATQIRNNVCTKISASKDFRKGVIYSAINRFPIVYSTVDVAVYRQVGDAVEILLGEKFSDGGGYRFVGGFVDTDDESHAVAAKRELFEEVGMIEVGKLNYIDSFKIDDRRYAGSKDSVLTTLFITQYVFGRASAQDDLDNVHWVALNDVDKNIVTEHVALANAVKNYFTK